MNTSNNHNVVATHGTEAGADRSEPHPDHEGETHVTVVHYHGISFRDPHTVASGAAVTPVLGRSIAPYATWATVPMILAFLGCPSGIL